MAKIQNLSFTADVWAEHEGATAKGEYCYVRLVRLLRPLRVTRIGVASMAVSESANKKPFFNGKMVFYFYWIVGLAVCLTGQQIVVGNDPAIGTVDRHVSNFTFVPIFIYH